MLASTVKDTRSTSPSKSIAVFKLLPGAIEFVVVKLSEMSSEFELDSTDLVSIKYVPIFPSIPALSTLKKYNPDSNTVKSTDATPS